MSTQMGCKHLKESELKFDNFLQTCVDNIDNKEITFGDTTTSLDSEMIKIPRDLIKTLDRYYNKDNKDSKIPVNHPSTSFSDEELERLDDRIEHPSNSDSKEHTEEDTNADQMAGVSVRDEEKSLFSKSE